MKPYYCLLLVFALSACSSAPKSACTPPQKARGKDIVYVVEHGWHAEVGIPADELDGEMKYFLSEFPGAKVFMFGYGKKTFFTAPPNTFSEYFIGPLPGTAVIHVTALSVPPTGAYPPEYTTTLALPKGGAHSLSNFIWEDLAKNSEGEPQSVVSNPEGKFYMAESRYNLFHTCNTWAADALQDAGLPISGGGVILSHQVTNQVEKAAAAQCD